MAVEAVGSVVIQKVTYLLIQESIIFDKVVDQVEDIRLELRRMQGFLTDAEERQETDDDIKEWVGKYLQTLYMMEDMVESYVLRLVCKKTKYCLFHNYGFYFHDLTASHKLRRKMKQIEGKVKELNKKIFQKKNEEKPGNTQDPSSRSISFEKNQKQPVLDITPELNSESLGDMSFDTSSFSQIKQVLSGSYEDDDSDFVGFKDYEKLLENWLTSKHGKMMGVVGPLGSGKTSLVKRIYNRKSIKEQFVCHAWLNVSEEQEYKDLLLKVWNQFNKKRDNELTILDERQLKEKLCEFLHDKKYLIVFDDVRKQPDAWRKLIYALPDMDGCKVVLVTRHKDIAESWDGDCQPLHLQPLSNGNSWKLFSMSYCLEESSSVISSDTSLPMQILEKCQGLPLNIMLLGGFLKTKKICTEEWKRLFSQAKWGSTDLWLLSYADLPAHYKLCLLYLTLFPKEFDLSVRRILRLWLAEGFLRHPPGFGEEPEDLAQECFDDLVKRNLVTISKFRSDGGPKKCRLPGFLRENLLPKAQEISLFHIHHMSAESRNETKPGVCRRIVEYADIKDYDSNSDFRNLRSYLSFNIQRYDTPATGVGNFLRRIIGSKGFGLLRVLDLEGVYKPILPPTLKHLFQLRYLGLRWTFLDSLPEAVGDLPYLETLDLKRTYINTLPSSVWKLKHLRHLNLPQVRLDMRMQQRSSQLLTLWGLVIDDGCNIENGLIQLRHLRELGITCQLESFDKLLSWITNLTHLQSLSLTSTINMGFPSTLSLKSLSESSKLSSLKLLGRLSSPLDKNQFPPNLRVLTLSVSNLEEDPMGILSQLQQLSVLRLLAKSYLGQKMNCPHNGFVNLRVLKLWMLDELEELEVNQGGMPIIKELNIRHCHKLKGLSKKLLQRTTLKELILTNMPEEFEKNVSKNISKHTNLQTNSYEFTLLPWEKDPEFWIDTNEQTAQE